MARVGVAGAGAAGAGAAGVGVAGVGVAGAGAVGAAAAGPPMASGARLGPRAGPAEGGGRRAAGAGTWSGHRAEPAWFAMVMATGIVSAAVRQAGWPGPAQVLLGAAAVCFVIIAVAVGWRMLHDLAGLRAELGRPRRTFTAFAAVAACGVLGNGLAAGGLPGTRAAAAALAGVALLLWLALTGRVLTRLGAWARDRMPITEVNGTWYLWAVGTQAVAITAAYLAGSGVVPARPAAVAGIAMWAAGLVLYLVIMVSVVTRLLRAGLAPADATAPYWVAMGAASISAFAAARLVPAVAAGLPAARPAVTGGGVAAWVLATWLVPVLAALTAARARGPARPPRYRVTGWMAVFPLGMYAAAGLVLGTTVRLPLIHRIGAVAVWPAAAAWALTTVAMAAAALTPPPWRPGGTRNRGAGPAPRRAARHR